jgi:3-hydroxyisobutyrate dehydrogenase-like beta-hydroxyacid dehydrogenase
MNIGFIGVGTMGSAMARHLGAAGHALTLYDSNPKQLANVAKRIAGAKTARTPREVGEHADIVVTMLPNGAVVRDVALGVDGLIAGMKKGALLLDTSSAQPWMTRETADALEARGIGMVDAPVSGAQEGAETATLVFMVGGEKKAVARVKPLLEIMGRHVFHVGPLSAGHTMKTVNNLATAVIWMATAEAMLIGKAHGLDAQTMVDVMNVSTSTNFLTQNKMKSEVLSRKFSDPFTLSLMLKDIGIATTLAEEKRIPVPVSSLTKQLWSAADKSMGAGKSIAEIVRWYEQMAGLDLA